MERPNHATSGHRPSRRRRTRVLVPHAVLGAASLFIAACGAPESGAPKGLGTEPGGVQIAAQARGPASLAAKIKSVGVSGTLCPPGGYSALLTEASDAVDVYLNQQELNVRGQLASATCTLTFELEVPPGYQFRQFPAAVQGFVYASKLLRGSVVMDVGYVGQGTPQSTRFDLSSINLAPGGFESFAFRGNFLDWSPTCGAQSSALRIQMRLQVSVDARDSATSEVEMSVDRIAADFYRWTDRTSQSEWRRCGAQ